MASTLKITYRKTGSLKPDKKNPKVHPPEQVTALAAAITEFGFTQPILTDGATIVAGEGRWLAARKLRLSEVPTIQVSGLGSEERRLALLVADNKLPTMGRWDQRKLDRVLKQIAKSDTDVKLTGFTDEDVARLADDLAEDVMSRVSESGPRGKTAPRTTYESEDSDRSEDDQMVTIAVVVTPDERDEIMEVLNEIRAELKKGAKLGDALYALVKHWIKTHKRSK